MRICCIGDQHFRFQLPYAAAFDDGRRREWQSVIEKIHETAKSCDIVVLLGDNLNMRHNHSSVNREFIKFLNGFGEKDVYIIAGNHERYGMDTAIDFLQNVGKDNWNVYTKPGSVKLGYDTIITFLPYMTPGSLNVENLEEANKIAHLQAPGGTILFHHHVMSGTVWGGAESEHINEIVLDRDVLEKRYDWIIGGHIHDAQRLSEKSLVAGNIFTQEMGEHKKSIFILDTEKKEIEEVPLPVRGLHKVFVTTTEIPTFDDIPENSVVKCVVTNRDVDKVALNKVLEKFDAHIIVEQYSSQREKVNLDDANGLDLSIENLLKVYAQARNVSHHDLEHAFALLEQQ